MQWSVRKGHAAHRRSAIGACLLSCDAAVGWLYTTIGLMHAHHPWSFSDTSLVIGHAVVPFRLSRPSHCRLNAFRRSACLPAFSFGRAALFCFPCISSGACLCAALRFHIA